MAASPRSTVSSDLYSPSEPARPPSYLPRDSDRRRGSHSPVWAGHAPDDGSGYSDTMQGLDSAGEDLSRPISVAAGQGPIRSFDITHKRKRDEYQEGYTRIRGHTGLAHDDGQSSIPKIDGSNLTNGGSFHEKDIPKVDDAVPSKRSRPNRAPLLFNQETRLSCEVSALPAALWQYIFCFVPPVFLGRLLRVNHAFSSYLSTKHNPEDAMPLAHSIMQPLPAEAIWVASRKRFAPGLPRPIHGMLELDMWRLLVGHNCQVCGLTQELRSVTEPSSPWETGPGKSGVRVIWPFGMRCCGSCLQAVSRKEFELYISSDCPSFLMPAIPFALVSDENNYIGHNLLRTKTVPSPLKMTKHFYKPAIEALNREFEAAIALGPAPAEEWRKGLTRLGQERMEDIIRWELWESKGGLKKVNSRNHPKPIPNGDIPDSTRITALKIGVHSERLSPQSVASSIKPSSTKASPALNPSVDPTSHTSSDATTSSFQPSWNIEMQHPGSTFHGRRTPLYNSRPERKLKDVNEARAGRKAEIERRCAAMDPPLLPNLLPHMESFQAAMQITQPMKDQAWQLLKPRLLAQLPSAERKEKERARQDEIFVEEYRQRRQQEFELKESKESLDREWETFQNPVRNRLGSLADEAIESRWAGGKSVTKDISPKFAADILLNVRQRFYAEIAQEDEANIAAGESIKTDPPNGPPTRKLVLENMKWLFDTKIKPLTDHFQRELFLCNGCDGNFKFYGFEGVIQHYAAKHTTTLSMGNIVVHWRAEWPEHPPFNPNPSVATTAYYKIPTPVNPVLAPVTQSASQPTSYGNFNPSTEPAVTPIRQRQDSSQYVADMYAATQEGSRQERYTHPISAQSTALNTIYAGNLGYAGAPNAYANSMAGYNPYPAPYQGQVTQTYGPPYPAQHPQPVFTQAQLTTTPQACYTGPNGHSYGNNQIMPYQSAPQTAASAASIPGPVSDLYQRQMDDMAKHAKDVFIGIGGVKDLPGSVRIYVVIQLTVARFKATFPNEPSLSMFIDGLDHNATMRPVRSVNGLGCKTCIQSGTGAKLFTLPHLVNHFRTVHVESPQLLSHLQAPELDWKLDMIDLPDASIISRLINATGMTDSKLGLIASVFKKYFPSPLPSLKGKFNTGPLPSYRREFEVNSSSSTRMPTKATTQIINTHSDLTNGHFNGHPYNGFPLSQNSSSEPPEPPGDDEYDPHRPAFLGKIVTVEPSSSQSYKPTRSSLPRDVYRSSGSFQSQPSPQLLPTDMGAHQPHEHGTVPQSRLDEENTYQLHNKAQITTRPHSPLSDAAIEAGGGLGVQSGKQSRLQRYDTPTRHNAPVDYTRVYRRAPTNGNDVGKPKSFHNGQRSASPLGAIDDADQFLSKLASKTSTGQSHALSPHDYGKGHHSEGLWQGKVQKSHRLQNYGEDGALDQWPSDQHEINRQEDGISVHQVRCPPFDLRDNVQAAVKYQPGSHAEYHEKYRPPGHVDTPLAILKPDNLPRTRYDTQQGNVIEEQEVTGSTSRRPHSRANNFQITHPIHYQPASASPHQVFVDTALYRPTSPVEEVRGDSGYRVQSPSVRRQNRSQKVTSYDYPQQARYGYIDDREIRQTQYHPRVEYVRVPVDYEDARPREPPPRYLVSRPVEHLEPEYVHYEQSYASEPMYERDGQIYHAPQREFQEYPSAATPSLSQSYKY